MFKVYDAVNEIMNEYSETLRLQNTEGLSEALNDTDKNDLLTAYLQWRIAVMQNMNCGYSEHTVQILNVTIETQSQEAVSVLVDYNENYIYNTGEEGYSNGNQVRIVFTYSESQYSVDEMDFVVDDYYDMFLMRVAAVPSEMNEASAEDNYENLLAVLVTELEEEALRMHDAEEMESQRESVAEILPRASYSYSGYRGARYASKYGASPNTLFKVYSANCTNFVSQCVWAAYGGWKSSMTSTEVTNNIKNKVRMVDGVWWAGSSDATAKWINVDYFWDYATKNSGNGPKCTGYNNAGIDTDVLAVDIAQGDVLQFSNDASDYTHSVYVVSTPGGSNPAYSDIYVASNSGNYSSRKLSEYMAGYTYMRQMQFKTVTFSN